MYTYIYIYIYIHMYTYMCDIVFYYINVYYTLYYYIGAAHPPPGRVLQRADSDRPAGLGRPAHPADLLRGL